MTLVLVGAMLALSLIMGGCGPSESDDDATPSKGEFILAANSICTTGVDLDPRRALGRHPSPTEFARFVRGVVLPTIQDEVDGIRALIPPEGDEEQISAILDSAQAAIDEIEAHPTALNAKPPGSLAPTGSRPAAEDDAGPVVQRGLANLRDKGQPCFAFPKEE
jgi:hypothetical protein